VPRPSSPGERRAEISGRAKSELSIRHLPLRDSGLEPVSRLSPLRREDPRGSLPRVGQAPSASESLARPWPHEVVTATAADMT